MSTLVLWDIDHTLLENAGVSKETYAAAFKQITKTNPLWPARTEGRTDRLIMREMLEAHQLQVPPWSVILEALTSAGRSRSQAMRARGSVLPGVPEALQKLGTLSGIVQALLTGNIHANARMKLEAVGLENSFDMRVGGYGEDSDDRSELVTIAQERASIAYGRTFSKDNTVLIGDTPRDVDAGRRGGAKVIAVASGIHSADELRESEDVIVLVDLSDTRALVDAVTRLTSQH